MTTHYGVIVCERLCEDPAGPADHADTDVRDVDCEACLKLRLEYLRAEERRVSARMANLAGYR